MCFSKPISVGSTTPRYHLWVTLQTETMFSQTYPDMWVTNHTAEILAHFSANAKARGFQKVAQPPNKRSVFKGIFRMTKENQI